MPDSGRIAQRGSASTISSDVVNELWYYVTFCKTTWGCRMTISPSSRRKSVLRTRSYVLADTSLDAERIWNPATSLLSFYHKGLFVAGNEQRTFPLSSENGHQHLRPSNVLVDTDCIVLSNIAVVVHQIVRGYTLETASCDKPLNVRPHQNVLRKYALMRAPALGGGLKRTAPDSSLWGHIWHRLLVDFQNGQL